MKIYVDLDGTLTDFDQQLADLMHLPLKRPMLVDDKIMWPALAKAGEGYWSTMPWISDGRELWDAVKKYNPIILSSPTRDQSSVDGKKAWLSKNLPGVPFIIDKNKDKYAAEGDILIDDRDNNIRKWREAGGIGILHKDAESTIKKIEDAVAQENTHKEAGKPWIYKPRLNLETPGTPVSPGGMPMSQVVPPKKGEKAPYKRQQEKDITKYMYAATKVRRAAEELLQADKPEFILTVGIPGSGKSYWIKSQTGYTVVSPDDIRREMGGDVSDQSKNAQVWALAKQRTLSALNRGQNVILDATNVDSQYRKLFISGLPDCIMKAKVFDVDPEVAKARIHKDLEQGRDRSVVPDHVIDRMYEGFKSTVDENQLEAEGFQVI